MTSLEVRTILGRAAANRQRLNQLLQVLDGDYWERRHPDDEWDVSGHLRHLVTIEPLIASTVTKAVEHGSAWLCDSSTTEGLSEAREAARLKAADLQPVQLMDEMAVTRDGTEVLLRGLGETALDVTIRFPPPSEWSPPPAVSLRQYLQVWAAHDLDHEGSIREAITIQPGAADLASSLRMRGR